MNNASPQAWHRRLPVLWVALAFALLAAACSGTITIEHEDALQQPDSDQIDNGAASQGFEVDGVIAFGDEDQPIEGFDHDVTAGQLDNGLKYFVRRNTAPGGRAELRLAVNAGSLQEDQDQSGVAHFLEHMLFNGTEKYPANELIAVLERFGNEFGPDINAYTSYDETVYQLSLPTDDDDVLEQGLDVLHEWAANATISEADVAAEVGVVVEEWRLRAQGSAGRINGLYDDLLVTGTAYEGRQPIGEIDALEAMTADKIRRFYRDWYRPNLMAVVVVGDIDVAEIEHAIEDLFGSLENPDDPRPLRSADLAVVDERAVERLGDPDRPTAYIESSYPQPAYVEDTMGEARRSAGFRVASLIVDTRFADDVSLGQAPYFAAYNSSTPIARDFATPGIAAEAEPAMLAAAFQAVSDELVRVRRDGFSTAEVERARSSIAAGIDQLEASVATTQDAEYAADLVNYFLGGGVLLSSQDQLALDRKVLNEVTPRYAQQEYLRVIDAAAPRIAVVGDVADVSEFPDEEELFVILDTLDVTDVPAREEAAGVPTALMDAPQDYPDGDTDYWPDLDTTQVRFENGVTVLIKETGIDKNSLEFWAELPGGTSMLGEDQLAAAAVAPTVVVSSGVGNFDQPVLDQILADDFVSLNVLPGDTDASLAGHASSETQEVLFQMAHLYLSSPRATDAALQTATTQLLPFAEDPGQLPDVVAADALFDLRMGNSPRFDALPDPDALADVTAADVLAVYDELYGNVNGMVIAVVGDVEVDKTIELASQYFGTLEANGPPGEWVDHARPPMPRRQEVEVFAGEDQQGRVSMLISAEVSTSQERDLQLNILQKVLAARLREQLRERLGAAYAPVAAISASAVPDEVVDTFIQVDGDPERIPTITEEIDAVLSDLRGGGLSDAEVATAAEQVRRDVELVSNNYWLNLLYLQQESPDIEILSVEERVAVVANTTTADMQELIDLVLTDSIAVVKLRPRS